MTLSGIQTSDTFWDVYRALLAAFEGLSQDPELDLTLATHFETSRSIAEDGMAILPGLKELRTGICIVCSRGEKYRYAGGAEQPPLPISWALQRESKPEDGQTGISDSDDSTPQPECADFTDSDDEGDSGNADRVD